MFARQLSGVGVVALISLAATPIVADSDGRFCSTSSYLAYEVGLSGVSPHELRIVSLEPPLTEHSMHSIPLPDFQVHGLLCREAEVLLLGWDHLYTVSLVSAGEPSAVRSEKLAHAGYRPASFPRVQAAQNLGSLAQEQVLPIVTFNANYFLVTRLTPSGRECELRVLSSLEEADHEGLLRFSLLLYDSTRGTECGR